jgi:hypothetical protein
MLLHHMMPLKRCLEVAQEIRLARPSGRRLDLVDAHHRLIIAEPPVERVARGARRGRGPGEYRLVRGCKVKRNADAVERGLGLPQRQLDDGELHQRCDAARGEP